MIPAALVYSDWNVYTIVNYCKYRALRKKTIDNFSTSTYTNEVCM